LLNAKKDKEKKPAVELASPAPPPESGTGEDVELDDLIDKIKTGKAFFNQGFAPQKREKKKGGTMKPIDLDLVAKAAEKVQTPVAKSQDPVAAKTQEKEPAKEATLKRPGRKLSIFGKKESFSDKPSI
jgi:hypothetical protein